MAMCVVVTTICKVAVAFEENLIAERVMPNHVQIELVLVNLIVLHCNILQGTAGRWPKRAVSQLQMVTGKLGCF